ncbi:unnamed protein product [Brassica rapa]|uniref:Reverse transcriptase zinc-binding domain-containing protein n=1 Tax=Brassica campestris TaxID=3711 RepID=A0A3P6ASA4_BRACM|nr:unnamed protein product [Brassica rapa]VDC90184.1 unnamed protein product [Brassica rapa]
MKVRDGLSTSFWHDIWTDMGCLSDLIGAGGFIEMGIRSTATVASPVARRKKHTGWIFITWLKQFGIINDLKCPIHMISLYGSKRKKHIGPNLYFLALGLLRLGETLLNSQLTQHWIKNPVFLFQITLHSIWRERNDRRHGATPMVAGSLAKMIDRGIRNWCLMVSATGHRHYEAPL